MCIPRVAPEGVGGKPPINQDARETIPGWSPYGARKDSSGSSYDAPAPPRLAHRADEFGRLEISILDCSLGERAGVLPWVDRRQAGRLLWKGSGATVVVLSEPERARARSDLVQAERCGTGFVAIQKYEVREDGDREVRLCAQTHCKTRRCARCHEITRRHQMARSEGDYSLFFTLTLPREGAMRRAWKLMPGRMRAWHRELRRELAIANRVWPEDGEKRCKQRRARILIARGNIRGEGKLEYAWCLEAHQDAWPHAHECLNLKWLKYAWARSLWRKIVRDKRARIDGRPVTSPDGVCRYLAAYVAKSRLFPELLVIIRGIRVWASTKRLEKKPDDGYIIENETTSDQARDDIENAEEWAEENGWILEMSKSGSYAKWWRQARKCPEIVVVGPGDYSKEYEGKVRKTRRRRAITDPPYLDAVLEMIKDDLEKRHGSCI